MPNLFPTNYQNKTITSDIVDAADTQIGYKPSIHYDINKGEVVRDGTNKVMTATGIEAWQQWCYNCLNTVRGSCAAVPYVFGIDREAVFKAESKEEAETILTVQITDALMADPYKRTKYVSSIDFNWLTPDSVELTVLVQGIDDAEIDIITTLR